jgi:hypothetical protein
VNDEIEIACFAADALGLRTVDPSLKGTKPDDVFGRLDTDAHLVTIICAGELEPVDARADKSTNDYSAVGDLLGPHSTALSN